MAATDVVSSLQREVQLVKEGLKGVDEDIKKLTGRDPSENRGLVGNRRVQLKRNFGERIGGPAQKRFVTRSAYSRLGPPPDNREQRFRPLESDGEDDDDDDDDHKPTLQSSVVAPPAPSRLKQETILNADKKTQTRNKRMFGVLLGTLQKFRETSSKEATREKRRKEIEQKLEEAATKEREEASRQRKELFFARKEKQKKLENLERKIEAAEELEEWEAHDQKLTKFIRSQTKPHIFYLPAKHNDHTLDLLEKTAKHLEGEMKNRRDDLQDVLHDAEVQVDEVAVDPKKNSKRRRTQEEDQDTVRKQDSGDNGEGEDERNGGIKEGKVEKDIKEKECEVKPSEVKENGEENEKERDEENEEVDRNERKRKSGESEVKEERNVRVEEESKQEEDQGQEVVIKTVEKDAVDTVEEKEKEEAPMQVDLEPNVAE